ncbi:MAG: hypothetical protein C0467_05960 [Planctomycetaceae bacterium]|nr:hypothetical protein [Planctomycetaceae bacterium]
MTEQDSFVRAILDDPNENTHRVVYADWLEEQNTAASRARAEFIRLQVSSAAETLIDPPIGREESLLKKWGTRWLPKTARLDAGMLGSETSFNTVRFSYDSVHAVYEFGRGFIATVSLGNRDGFDGRMLGHLMRECLANNPVERFLFHRWEHRPLIAVEVAPAHGDWRVDMRLGQNAEELFSTLITGTRKQLLKGLPNWMSEEFERIDVEPDPAEIPF